MVGKTTKCLHASSIRSNILLLMHSLQPCSCPTNPFFSLKTPATLVSHKASCELHCSSAPWSQVVPACPLLPLSVMFCSLHCQPHYSSCFGFHTRIAAVALIICASAITLNSSKRYAAPPITSPLQTATLTSLNPKRLQTATLTPPNSTTLPSRQRDASYCLEATRFSAVPLALTHLFCSRVRFPALIASPPSARPHPLCMTSCLNTPPSTTNGPKTPSCAARTRPS